MARVVLDFINNLEFESEEAPFTNYHSIYQLQTGMHKLAYEIRLEELKLNNSGMVLGADYTFNTRNNLLACYFDWFSISITNYFRLVGLFDIMIRHHWKSNDVGNNSDVISSHCTKYVKETIPEIYSWKNKISAHRAATNPKNDNLGTLKLSIACVVTYSFPYYVAGGYNLSSAGEESKFKQWAVTETFERLRQRYWPHLTIPTFEKS